MTEPEQFRRPRLVVDPNVLVAAAISSQGAPALLLQLVEAGAAVMVVSPLLLQEAGEVLRREKFRRWLALEHVEEYLQAVVLLSEEAVDPLSEGVARACRDPDDDYLVFLAEHVRATLLVSGDKDLLSLNRPGLDVRSPRDTLDGLSYEHPWGPGLMPADAQAAWAQAVGEGHDQVLQTAAAFLDALKQRDVKQLLPHLVTPESLQAWRRGVRAARSAVADRGMTNRAEYPAANVAYVKLTPDPGETIRADAATKYQDLNAATAPGFDRRTPPGWVADTFRRRLLPAAGGTADPVLTPDRSESRPPSSPPELCRRVPRRRPARCRTASTHPGPAT